MKKLFLATSVAAIALSAYVVSMRDDTQLSQVNLVRHQAQALFSQRDIPIIPTSSGSYLASRAAQHRNEWKNAAQFLDEALVYASAKNNKVSIEKTGPVLTGPVTADDMEQAAMKAGHLKIEADNAVKKAADKSELALAELKQRVLIFNLGAGNYDAALRHAKEIVFDEQQDGTKPGESYHDRLGFARGVLAVDDFRKGDYDALGAKLETLNAGAVAQSLKPLLSVFQKIGAATSSDSEIEKKVLEAAIRKEALMPLHEAYALEAAGLNEAAQKQYEKVAKLSDSVAADLTLASFYIRQNNNEKALGLLKALVEQLPDDKEIKDLYAALEKGDVDVKSDPIVASLSAHAKTPQTAMAICLYEMAMNHMANQSQETALLMGQMAYAISPELNQVNFMLVDILKERGNYDQALQILDNIDSTNRSFAEAVISRAEILDEQGKHGEAISVLEKALQENADPDIAFHLAGLYRMDKKFDEALAAYNQVEELADGKLPERLWSVYYYRGVILSELDNWDEAEKQLLLAKEHNPHNPYILNYLGYSWVDNNKNVEEGLEILKTALKLSPHSGFITDSVGWAYYKLGDYDNASIYLERAAELMPYDPEVNDHLGDLYWQTGRKLEAYYQWRRAIEYAEKDNSDHDKIVTNAKHKMQSGL